MRLQKLEAALRTTLEEIVTRASTRKEHIPPADGLGGGGPSASGDAGAVAAPAAAAASGAAGPFAAAAAAGGAEAAWFEVSSDAAGGWAQTGVAAGLDLLKAGLGRLPRGI